MPAAQALVQLRTLIYSHQMPGLNSQGELFIDAVHPSVPLEALNAYLHYAVIYRQSPVGLPILKALKDAKNNTWDENFNKTLQAIAWDVVSTYPRSGVEVAKPGSRGRLPARSNSRNQ